jgi:hypothetical protein
MTQKKPTSPDPPTREARLSAVEELYRLSLPVADPKIMKQESTPSPEDLLPV